jgi:dCTP diphosphatase
MTLIDSTALAQRLQNFADERDWQRFHTPRNLAMALAGEVGELLAEIQWLNDDDIISELETGGALRRRLASELADVTSYLVRLATVLDIDLDAAVQDKLDELEVRYDADKVRGSAEKH